MPPVLRRGGTSLCKGSEKTTKNNSLTGSRRQPSNVTAKKVPAAKVNPQKRAQPILVTKTTQGGAENLSEELKSEVGINNLQKAELAKDTSEKMDVNLIPESSGSTKDGHPTEVDPVGKSLENEMEQDENTCANNVPNIVEESNINNDCLEGNNAVENVQAAHVENVDAVIKQADDAENSEAPSDKIVKRSTRRTRSRRVSPGVDANSESLNERAASRYVRRQRRGAVSKKLDERPDVEPVAEPPGCNKPKEVDTLGEPAEQQSPAKENEKHSTSRESQSQPKRASGRRKIKVASSTVAEEDTDTVQAPSNGDVQPRGGNVLLDASLTPLTLGDKRTDRTESGGYFAGPNASQDQSVETDEVQSVKCATGPVVAEKDAGIDGTKLNPPSASGSRRNSLLGFVTSFFTDSAEKENPQTTTNTASEVASPETDVLASTSNRRDSIASNCSSCSAGERTIDTTGLVDTKPYYSLNPAMLNDRNLWQDQNLRKLCKILRISSSGGYEDILDRLNYWNRDYEALTQLLERKKNKKVDSDDSSRDKKAHTGDRQHLAVCNFHSLALGKQHILPMYLRPLKRLSRKLRHKPILSNSARPNDHLHFTPRPVKKNKPKPALVFSPYNQVVTFNLRKEERQEKRKRIYEIAQSVDCMDNPIADLEGDERWVEARRNLFENCFRVRQCTDDEPDLPNDDAFDPLYFRSGDHAGNSDLLSWSPNERPEENSSLQCFASSAEKLGSSVFEDSPLDSENNTVGCDAGTPPRQHSHPAPVDRAVPVRQQRRAVASMLVPTPPRGRPRTDVVGLLEQSQSSSEESYSSGDNCEPAGNFAETVSM